MGLLFRKFLKIGILGVVIILCLAGFRTVERNEDWDTNYTLFKSAVETHPQNMLYQHYLGEEYFFKEEYDKAIEHYQNALDIYPESSITRNRLGLAYAKRGEYQKALEQFERIVEAGKASEKVWGNLGNVYHQLERYDKAIEAYENALKLNPKRSFYKRKIGELYLQSGNYDQAIQNFKSLLDKEYTVTQALDRLTVDRLRVQNRIFCYRKLAECYQKKGMVDSAEFYSQKLEELKK